MWRKENLHRNGDDVGARFDTLVRGILGSGFCLFWNTLRWSLARTDVEVNGGVYLQVLPLGTNSARR